MNEQTNVAALFAAEGDEEDLLVRDIMTRPIVTVAPNDTVLNAVELMRNRAIHRLLVMNGASLVGIVSTTDIARAVADGDITRIRR